MSKFTPTIKRVEPKSQGKQSQLKLGAQLLKEKRFEEAEAEFTAFIRENPTSLRGNLALGNLKYRTKDYEEALDYYKTAIRLDPAKTPGYLRAARVYLKQNQPDNALEQFNNVLKLDPKSFLAYVGMGYVYFVKSEYEQAVGYFSKAIKLNPRSPMARLRLALTFIRMEKLSEAVSQINSAVRLEPQNPQAYAALGQIYLQRQEYSAAVETFQLSAQQKPEMSASTRFGLVEALIQCEQLEEAEELLTQMPETEKYAVVRHKLWGDIYHRQGLFREATEEYNAAKLLNSEDGAELNELENIDFSLEEDDLEWEKLAGKYKKSTNNMLSDMRTQSLLRIKSNN